MRFVKRKNIKYIFIGVIVAIACFALLDSAGIFNPKPYRAVSLGTKVYYVPKDHDPDVSIDKFPTVKPLPSEVITPTGQLVPKDSLNTEKK